MSQYYRHKLYPLDEVLDYIAPITVADQDAIREYDSKKVKMNSERYQVFAKELKCCKCGIEGKFFALEKDKNQKSKFWHFNLYALDEEGCEVLMTKDHIVPRSIGGEDVLGNFRTMCSKCNNSRGNGHQLITICSAEEGGDTLVHLSSSLEKAIDWCRSEKAKEFADENHFLHWLLNFEFVDFEGTIDEDIELCFAQTIFPVTVSREGVTDSRDPEIVKKYNEGRFSVDEWSKWSVERKVCGILECSKSIDEICPICNRCYCEEHWKMHQKEEK